MNDEKDINFKKTSLFKRIVNFFKKLFGKNTRNEKIALPNVENVVEEITSIDDEIDENDFYGQMKKIGYRFEKQEIIKDDDSADKNEFFELYKEFKDDKINIEDIDNSDLIKINAMLNSELKIRKDALKAQQS